MKGEEVLASARYGDAEELDGILTSASDNEKQEMVNYVQNEAKNTPLHMASANGHTECVQTLLKHGAQHLPNESGNYPLHWAVQNKHLGVVKALLEGVSDIDVLARNGFGRGSITEAFQCEDPDILAALLEHGSATEERLAEGTGVDVNEDENENEMSVSTTPEKPTILQESELHFKFGAGLPTLKARELALDWNKKAFGSTAEEDITGVTVWSASLLLSRYIVDHADDFQSKSVCELGAGCGVSGIAAYLYTLASRVVISDLFESTLENLQHNAKLNELPSEEEESGSEGCDQCGTLQRFSADNPEGVLMACAACRSVQYCSRECQKKAWKGHKTECKRIRKQREELQANKAEGKLEVAKLDWSKPETWPSGCFDVLLGSDLVYHGEIVPVLVKAIDGLLSNAEGSRFIHVASQARDSLVEFKEEMERLGFECHVEVLPDEYKKNPLVGDSTTVELFDLHFNEMSDVYCVYTFTRLKK